MRKSLQELTIKDNFMFAAVMIDEELCREFLEMALQMKIAKVKVFAEKTIVYNPQNKGVRLDIEAEDEKHTHYDVEMQVSKTETLLRSRYYHSHMDMELLSKGAHYNQLPNSYVIFICDFDPLGEKKYRYSIYQKCEEAPDKDVSAGIYTVLLSTKGTNDTEVPIGLQKFLSFVGSALENSADDFQDLYVEKVQMAIESVKHNREMGERYMQLEELFAEEREEGREEGKERTIFEFVAEGDCSIEKAAAKLGLSVEEFSDRYNQWVNGI